MDFYDVIGSILERKYFTRTGVLNANLCINLIMISLKKKQHRHYCRIQQRNNSNSFGNQ